MLSAVPLTDGPWRDFVPRQGDATAFHLPEWGQLIERTYGFRSFALVRTVDGQVVSGLPVIEVIRRARRRWICLPFTDRCSPLGDANELEQEIEETRQAAGVDSVEIRSEIGSVGGREVALWHVLPLDHDPDVVLRRAVGNVRRSVKKIEREGELSLEHARSREHLTTDFYGLHLETRRRLGVPVQPRRFFQLLWDTIIEPGHGFVLLARAQGVPVGGAVYLAAGRTLVYKFGATSYRHRRLHPNSLIFAEAIRWACARNYCWLDFGRTDLDNDGLRFFKTSWGCIERPLVYSSVGGAAPKAPRVREGSAAATVIRRGPPIVCRLAGELFYKYAA